MILGGIPELILTHNVPMPSTVCIISLTHVNWHKWTSRSGVQEVAHKEAQSRETESVLPALVFHREWWGWQKIVPRLSLNDSLCFFDLPLTFPNLLTALRSYLCDQFHSGKSEGSISSWKTDSIAPPNSTLNCEVWWGYCFQCNFLTYWVK